MSSPRLSQAIAQDHRAITALHEQYPNDELHFAELTLRILLHAFAEEHVLHPLYIDHLKPDGRKIAEGDRTEHETLKNLLLQLARDAPPGSPEHLPRLTELMRTLTAHFSEEEQDDLPRLENVISAAVSTDAASRFLQFLRVPRPHYPTLEDLLSAPTDKIKAELTNSLAGSERSLRAAVETKN